MKRETFLVLDSKKLEFVFVVTTESSCINSECKREGGKSFSV